MRRIRDSPVTCASRARRTMVPPRKEDRMNEIEIVCGSSPDELRQADHITVNGVEFVTAERHDGAKDMRGTTSTRPTG